MKITEFTTLKDILNLETGEDVLKKHGVPCMSCPMAALELNILTIGEVCQIYKLNLEKILEELNENRQ